MILNVNVSLAGSFEFDPTELSFQASVNFREQGGGIVLGREKTFVKLDVDAESTLALEGNAGLAAGLTLNLPQI